MNTLGVVDIVPVFKISPKIKIRRFKLGEYNDHCGSHLLLIGRSEERWFNNVTDSFEVCGWHFPAGTTGEPWRPLSVDQVLSRTYETPGHIDMCLLLHIPHYSLRTRMVQWCHAWKWQPRQCTLNSIMVFVGNAQGVYFPGRCCF